MTGSYDVFEKTGCVHSGPVSIHFAPPIATAAIPAEERGRLTDQVFTIIAGMVKKENVYPLNT
jgi:1-acyl-sn-glycerol-3-phosphate acyltransferase